MLNWIVCIALVITISLIGTLHAEPEPIIVSCVNGKIGGLQTINERDMSVPTSNQKFDIVIPNGECKNNVVLTADDYKRMQNNVGYFTVKNKISTTEQPTTSWCPMEKWIWDGHIGYYNMTKYEKWMLTDYCKAKSHNIVLKDTLVISDGIPIVSIPEFGTIALMILVIAIIGIIAVNVKTRILTFK